MRGIRHPFTGALYEEAGDGHVRVTLGSKTGLFSREGRRISGELREADPHLCGWVAGPRVVSQRISRGPGSDGT